ncbi:MAG: hypothetical protein KAT56_03010 [Sedimentisphaerales bacterium]|nr:hypothetical protein [Sedimentisphaerales bacterium]
MKDLEQARNLLSIASRDYRALLRLAYYAIIFPIIASNQKANAKATATLTKISGFRRRRPWRGHLLRITTKELPIDSHITNLSSVLWFFP